MSDLLPHNATAQEAALAATVGVLGDVPVPLRDIWNPDTCPPDLLAWLAWAFSVDQWDSGWTDAQQREFIKRSIQIHRYKGTIGAVQDALAALFFDVRVQEWFNQSPPGVPYTFRILLQADQIGISQQAIRALFEVVRRTKNLRSHLTEVQLSVRSVAGPYLAAAAGVGHDIGLPNFKWGVTVISETVMIAPRVEAVAFDFTAGVVPASVSSKRSTTGTYRDSSGVIRSAGIDATRLNWTRSADGQPLVSGLLKEAAATNLHTLSATTTSGGSNLTVQNGAGASPDGGNAMQALVPNTTRTFHVQDFVVTGLPQNTVHCCSVYVRKGSGRSAELAVLGDNEASHTVTLDFQTGAVGMSVSQPYTSGGGSTSGYGAENLGGGLWRMWIAGVPNTAATSRRMRIAVTDATGSTLFAGDGSTPALYVWGRQIEAGAAPSSYIPTASSPVTRAGDVVTLDLGARGVADGRQVVKYTFDDGSTQEVMTVISGGLAQVPTLNKTTIRRIDATKFAQNQRA